MVFVFQEVGGTAPLTYVTYIVMGWKIELPNFQTLFASQPFKVTIHRLYRRIVINC